MCWIRKMVESSLKLFPRFLTHPSALRLLSAHQHSSRILMWENGDVPPMLFVTFDEIPGVPIGDCFWVDRAGPAVCVLMNRLGTKTSHLLKLEVREASSVGRRGMLWQGRLYHTTWTALRLRLNWISSSARPDKSSRNKTFSQRIGLSSSLAFPFSRYVERGFMSRFGVCGVGQVLIGKKNQRWWKKWSVRKRRILQWWKVKDLYRKKMERGSWSRNLTEIW